MPPFVNVITEQAELAELYRAPADGVARKKRPHLDAGSAAFIATSPFVLVGTVGADGSVDVSPRGGAPGFAHTHHDEASGHDYVLVPDLNGNNLLDTLRGVVATGQAGLLFLVPGNDETVRVNGAAWLTTDPSVLDRFTEIRRPKSALAVRCDEVFVHCAKAFRRGRVWEPESWDALGAAPGLEHIICAQGLIGDVDPALVRADLEQGYALGLAEDLPEPAWRPRSVCAQPGAR